jgi:hypothetical protein
METLHPNPQGHQPPLNRNIGGIPLSEHLPPVTEGLRHGKLHHLAGKFRNLTAFASHSIEALSYLFHIQGYFHN